MIKAVIFDLDNTLVDFWAFKTKSVDSAIKAMIKAGLKINKKKAMRIISRFYKRHGMEYKYIFQEMLEEAYGRVDWRILAHGLVAYRKTRGNLLSSYKGVKPTLKKLKQKGYKLAIISDAPRLKAWVRLASMGIAEMFDAVVTFDDTGKRKPHSLPFKLVLKKLEIKPKESVMVGDNAKRDITGARKAGMKTVFARYGCAGRIKKTNADFEILKIEDLLDVIKWLEKKA